MLIFESPWDICAAFPGKLNDPNPCGVFAGILIVNGTVYVDPLVYTKLRLKFTMVANGIVLL